ncbi:hypothetical protein [Porphyromonas sp. COT-108 OH1349]|uniref:hypothetical protein n=1 Tax=Porphyromonas sp. COT-108 OH1349 TaxID=1537504 RepID=UPI00052E1AFA|nr:hypothetical protein [Porphyromonas sp. COT-108 OH1349]KGN67424.1 hypothetical protein JT26_09360 [Porphyromonas sp. COT-108 OH1349]
MNSKTFALATVFLILLSVLLTASVGKGERAIYGYNPGDMLQRIKVEGEIVPVSVGDEDSSIVHFWSIEDAKSRLTNALLNERCKGSDVNFISICIDGSLRDMEQCLALDGIDPQGSFNKYLRLNDYRTLARDFEVRKGQTKTFLVSASGIIEEVFSNEDAWKTYSGL